MDPIYHAFYQLSLCERVGPRGEYGADNSGWRGPYPSLLTLAKSGELSRHPLLLDLLVKRLPNYKSQPSRVGNLNWEEGLPELLLSCPILRPNDLHLLDQAACGNTELWWMRIKVAQHPSVTIEILEKMTDRGFGTDSALAAVVSHQLNKLREAATYRSYKLNRRREAQNRLHAFLARTDPVGYALRLFEDGTATIEDTLEAAGVGPRNGDVGLIGGGRGASAPDDDEFDPAWLPAGHSPERIEELEEGSSPTDDELQLWRAAMLTHLLHDEQADQYDIWQLSPTRAGPAFAISWRDLEGRTESIDGFYRSIKAVRAALKKRYDRVDIWMKKHQH